MRAAVRRRERRLAPMLAAYGLSWAQWWLLSEVAVAVHGPVLAEIARAGGFGIDDHGGR